MTFNRDEKRDVNITDNNSKYYIVFVLNNQDFGFYVKDSREIITLKELTILPETPEYIKGIIDLRGEIIPIVDLNRRLSLEDCQVESDKVIVVSINNKLMGINVDRVKEIVMINEEEIAKTREIVQDINQNFVEGVARIKDRLLVILDLHRILAGDEIEKEICV